MAMELTGNWADADDLAQMVFIKTYRGLGIGLGVFLLMTLLPVSLPGQEQDEAPKSPPRRYYVEDGEAVVVEFPDMPELPEIPELQDIRSLEGF